VAIVERYKRISYFPKRDKIKEGKLINEKVVRDEFPQYFWKKIIVVETK
jgi:CTP:phosphocholine cytidylyltransferase-like protein